MNALTIADALATKYASLTPPTGYPAIRRSTARPPNKIGQSPFVTVIQRHGEVVLGAGELNHSLEFHVIFHYAKHTADLARDMAGMLAWIGVLLTATWSDMDLGVAGVRKAYPTEYDLIVATFGGDEWYGWDITVVVDFNETVSLAA